MQQTKMKGKSWKVKEERIKKIRVKVDMIIEDRVKENQIKGNRIKENQIKGNRIKVEKTKKMNVTFQEIIAEIMAGLNPQPRRLLPHRLILPAIHLQIQLRKIQLRHLILHRFKPISFSKAKGYFTILTECNYSHVHIDEHPL